MPSEGGRGRSPRPLIVVSLPADMYDANAVAPGLVFLFARHRSYARKTGVNVAAVAHGKGPRPRAGGRGPAQDERASVHPR